MSVDSGLGVASLFDLFRLLWARRGVIAAIVLPVVVVTGLLVKQMTPTYTAEGAIVVASEKFTIPEVESAWTMPTGDLAIVRSEMSALTSRDLLNQVATKLGLDQKPEFNKLLEPPNSDLLARLNPMPFIRGLFSVPGKRANTDALVSAMVDATLLKHLAVTNGGRDYVITVDYKSEDPALSASIVNTLMDDYLANQMAAKTAATVGANASLNARAEQLQREANEADAKIAEFATKSGYLETKEGSVSAQQLADLNSQLSLARADRAVAEARYQQALSAQKKAGSPAETTDVLASPLIQELRAKQSELDRASADIATRLGPEHPDRRAIEAQAAQMRETIGLEIDKILQSLRNQVDTSRAREVALERRLMTLQPKSIASAALDEQMDQLKRDAQSRHQVYDEFMTRVAETGKASDLQQPDAHIIARAVAPISPSGPRTFLAMALAGLASTMLAVAAVLSWDQLDHGFETLDQVRRTTGVPGFAAIPIVRDRGRKALPADFVIQYPNSPLAETLRAFRTRLATVSDATRATTVLISSSVPGEGKTSFALAFARLTAMDGHRVLLIECDLRRPTLNAVLPSAGKSGFADVLSGRAPWRDNVGIDRASGMHYLTAPHMVREAPQVLESRGLQALLRETALSYDYVVIDSPPLMRVSDAAMLARSADAIMLLVSSRQTRRDMVAEALSRLNVDEGKPIGVVLTKVDVGRDGRDAYRGYAA